MSNKIEKYIRDNLFAFNEAKVVTKEKLSNKVNTINNSTTNYPSTSAIYNYGLKTEAIFK